MTRVLGPASVTEQPLQSSLTGRAGNDNAQGPATMAVLLLPRETPQLAVISEGPFLLLLSETGSKGFF